MKLSHAVLGIALVVAPVGLFGCAAAAVGAAGAAAGAGALAYSKGNLETTVQAPLDKTWQATLAATDDLGLTVAEQQSDAFHGHLVASQVKGGDVKIDLSKQTPDVTKVSIRVGTFGDEQQSLAILRKIRANLGQG
jgi:hypothetical protein